MTYIKQLKPQKSFCLLCLCTLNIHADSLRSTGNLSKCSNHIFTTSLRLLCITVLKLTLKALVHPHK